MRFLILIMLLSLLPISLKAQSMPHSFTDGDIIYADQINENFEYLLKRTAIHQTNVDCDAGETINSALEKYNHIIISGTCNENIFVENHQNLLILEGSNENASLNKIIAATSDNATIKIDTPLILNIKNLNISGGNRGLEVEGIIIGMIENCIIENNQDSGIAIWTGSKIGIKDSIIQNNGRPNDWAAGIEISTSLSYVINSNIKNHSYGPGIWGGNNSTIFLYGNTIENGIQEGVKIQDGSVAKIGKEEDDDGNFRGNIIKGFENGIHISNGSFAEIKSNTIEDGSNNGIEVRKGSVAKIGDRPDSMGNSRGNIITGPFERGIHVSMNSYTDIVANQISGYSRQGIDINSNSSAVIGSDSDQDTYDSSMRSNYGNTLDGSVLPGESVEEWQRGIQVSESSTVQLKRNLIENNSGGGIRVSENSVLELGGGNIIQNNMHTESNGEIEGTGIELRSGSTLEMWSDAQEREPNTITGNGRYAFRAEGSHLDLRGGDDGNTQNNRLVISGHQTGIRASKGSKVTLERVDVKDNTNRGIRISENSVLNVYDGGVTITGNGLIGDQCHDDSDYGLKIRDNSLAELSYITVSNNCNGINVDTNSTLEGGWAGENSNIDYGIVVKGNLRNVLEVQKNSVVDLSYLRFVDMNN